MRRLWADQFLRYTTAFTDLEPFTLTLSFGYDSEPTHEEAVDAGIGQSQIVEYHIGNLIPNYPTGRLTFAATVDGRQQIHETAAEPLSAA